MNTDELRDFLDKSLTDFKLSGGEKTALADWLTGNVTSEQQRGLARHTAFDIARSTLADPASVQLVNWLEGVLKVLIPGDAPATHSVDDRAFFAPGEHCLQHIIHCFGECRQSADVCVFTITDDRISRAILASHRRGIKVRILSDRDKSDDTGSDLHRFREEGMAVKLADVRQQANPHVEGHMHHKFAIFDGTRLLNGSYNWTRGAAEANLENLIDSSDPGLVAAFAKEFKRLWNRY